MQRRVLAVGLGATAFVMLGTGAAPARHSLPDERLALYEEARIVSYNDTAPAGPSPGDQFVFNADFFRRSNFTEKVADVVGYCVTVTPVTFEAECTVTAHFPKGDLQIQGILKPAPATSDAAIVGGTGRYDRARGHAVSIPLNADGTRSRALLDIDP